MCSPQLMRNIGGMLLEQQDPLSVQWRSEELGCLAGGGTLLSWKLTDDASEEL